MKNFLVNRAVGTAKKNFNLRWLLVPILLIVLGVGNVWGATSTFNSFSGIGSSGYPSGSTTISNITYASNGWYGYSASQLRVASSKTLTISCSNDYKITSIDFTVTGNNYATLTDVSWDGTNGTYENASGTTSQTFTATGQCRISRIEVTYEAAGGGTETSYNLVTSASSLSAGDVVVFGAASYNAVAGAISGSYLTKVDATISNGVLTASNALEFTLGGTSGSWTFTNGLNTLRATSTTELSLATSGGNSVWTISINNSNNATIAPSGNYSSGTIYYNSSSPRFKNYTSAQRVIQIYKKTSSTYTLVFLDDHYFARKPFCRAA